MTHRREAQKFRADGKTGVLRNRQIDLDLDVIMNNRKTDQLGWGIGIRAFAYSQYAGIRQARKAVLDVLAFTDADKKHVAATCGIERNQVPHLQDLPSCGLALEHAIDVRSDRVRSEDAEDYRPVIRILLARRPINKTGDVKQHRRAQGVFVCHSILRVHAHGGGKDRY